MDDEGWVRGPALEIVRAVRGWKEGDEVEVDTGAWASAHKWVIEHRPALQRGYISGFTHVAIGSTPQVRMENTDWLTAHEYIVAWRPRRREP